MTPNELKIAISKAIDKIMVVGETQIVRFEDIYSNFVLVRSYTDALSLYGIDEFGNKFKLLTITTKVGKGKIEHIIYQMMSIKDFGGFI